MIMRLCRLSVGGVFFPIPSSIFILNSVVNEGDVTTPKNYLLTAPILKPTCRKIQLLALRPSSPFDSFQYSFIPILKAHSFYSFDFYYFYKYTLTHSFPFREFNYFSVICCKTQWDVKFSEFFCVLEHDCII